MAETVTMPKLGFDMAEGTLVRWVIQEGEPVAKGAVLAEIETDKATVEVESSFDGVLARQLVSAGDIVPINTPIAVVAAPGEKIEAGPAAAPMAKPAAAAPVTEQQAPTPEAAPASGEADAGPAAAPQAPLPEAAPAGGEADAGMLPEGVKASPLARRMAEEMGVPIQSVAGTGPGGRIVRKDIENYQATKPAAAPPKAPAAPRLAPMPVSQLAPAPEDELAPLNRLRMAIGRRMVEAKQQVPHFYITREYDMADLMALRKAANAMLPENEKLSVNDFILKATALTLRSFPNLNATFQGDKVLRHGHVNIGVAVAVEGGLLTVVNRDTDRKSLRTIAVEVRSMVARARDGKVRPDDIEGSTFSVSNLGMYDVDHFIAIINPPEAAILAVGAVREVPVVKDGAIVPGTRMKATISVDHRVSDGAEAGKFMQALALYLEEPLRLML